MDDNEAGHSGIFISRNTPTIVLVLVLALFMTIPHLTGPVHGSSSPIPSLVGWGGSRLVENENYSTPSIPSIVFPGENASDQEILSRTIVQDGSNAIRASFAPYCTNPNGFISPYNNTRLSRAIKIAATLGLWIIVDYHGYNDTFNQPSCWLNFWNGLVSQFKNSYSKIIWEPLNEPQYRPWIPTVCSSESNCLSYLSLEYQAFINQTRAQGDNHWIVVQNICSFECILCADGINDCPQTTYGYPTVKDPLGRIFMSIHPYMSYRSFHSAWNNTSAINLADDYYQAMVNETARTGFSILNTEGGPGPTTATINGTTVQCPDLILPGVSGYCRTNLLFIQTLTSLMESHLPQRLDWVWWPAGDWSDSPGAGVIGSLATGGWGQQLIWQRTSTNNLVLTSAKGGTIFPATGNYSFIQGTIVNITSTPAYGFYTNWQFGNGSSTIGRTIQVDVNRDQMVSAQFPQLIYGIEVTQLASATAILPGTAVEVNATVRNVGTVAESFNVSIYSDTSLIGSERFTDIAPGTSTAALFIWNTNGVEPGTHSIRVVAGPIDGVPGSVEDARSATLQVSQPAVIQTGWVTSIGAVLVNPTVWLAIFSALICLGLVVITNRSRTQSRL